MTEWRVMPYWTRYYIFGDSRTNLMNLVRADAGPDADSIIRRSVCSHLERMLPELPQMQSVVDALKSGTITPDVDDVVLTVAVHQYVMDRVRESMTAELYAHVANIDDQPEEQLILTIVALIMHKSLYADTSLIDAVEKAVLSTFGSLVGPEGRIEASILGPGILLHQCLGEIILQDESLLAFLQSRVPFHFTYR